MTFRTGSGGDRSSECRSPETTGRPCCVFCRVCRAGPEDRSAGDVSRPREGDGPDTERDATSAALERNATTGSYGAPNVRWCDEVKVERRAAVFLVPSVTLAIPHSSPKQNKQKMLILDL